MQRTTSQFQVELSPTKADRPVPREIAVNLSPVSVTRLLLAAVLALGCASTAIQMLSLWTGKKHIFGLVRLLNLDEESNFPTALSVLLLAIASLLLAGISFAKRRTSHPLATQWTVLTVGFVLMTLDEFVMLHDLLVAPSRRFLGTSHLGLLYFSWVLPAFIGLLAIGIYFISFLRNLPRDTMFRFIVAGAVYVGGCVGVEMLGGMRYEQSGPRDPLYVAIVTLEELMEMTGIVFFIRALLLYLSDTSPDVRLSLRFSKS